MISLSGQVALVTGGATGIGQAIAIRLAQAGADVAVTVNRRPAEDTLDVIKETGQQALALPCDLASLDAQAAEDLLEAVETSLGTPVSILVNNADIVRR